MQKQADIYTKAEDLPRRGSTVVSVELTDPSEYVGVRYRFDDGSTAYVSTDVGRRIPEEVGDDRAASDHMSDDQFKNLIVEALDYEGWDGSGVYKGSVLRLIRFLLSGVRHTELEDNAEGLVETVGEAVEDAKIAARVAHRYC